jgi:hypothetical protein
VVHQGLQRDCQICAQIQSANAAHYRSSEGVSLAEMTRRRDGWKERAELAERDRDAALDRILAMGRELESERNTALAGAENLKIMRALLTASQNEARRYAELCGSLRAELEELRKGSDGTDNRHGAAGGAGAGEAPAAEG